MRDQNKPPVTVGDTLTLHCPITGSKGDAIGKIQGYAIIVKNATPDKTYRIQITRTLGTMAFADIIEEEDEGGV